MRFIVKYLFLSLSLIITLTLDASDVLAVFPKTVEEMQEALCLAKTKAEMDIAEIVAIPKQARTFENTIKAFDRAKADFMVPYVAISTLEMVHPDSELRRKAEEVTVHFSDFLIDAFESNKAIYQAFIECEQDNLTDEQEYYLKNAIESFQMDGLQLDDDELLKLNDLAKQIAALSTKYYSNIASDLSFLKVTKDELLGLDEQFINSLDKDGDSYILMADNPTYQQVLSKCHVEATRKACYHLFENRGYPQNLELLQNIAKLRHEYANLLGYKTYAEFDIKGQMAGSPSSVQQFLDEKTGPSLDETTAFWKQINNAEKINSWDSSYLVHNYKCQFLKVDQSVISEYFPFEKTLQGMFSIFGKFLSMEFTAIPTSDLWHPDVQLIEVRDSNANVIGHLVLDLFPRNNKYTHCCCNGIVRPKSTPLAVIITNFSKASPDKPSLLSHAEVVTLFHEFGHAIHDLTGKAEMPSKCGSNTVHDFVEMPSQFFEEFAWDPEILTLLSSHYITGEPLSSEVISRMNLAGINDGSSATSSSEITYSLISLHLFNQDPNQDLLKLQTDIKQKIMPWIKVDQEDYSLCTFEHLIDYGAKYYTYLWSKVLAEKVYSYVKAHGGLQDSRLGKRYIEKIIGKGGSVAPELLMEDFLSVPLTRPG